ncbi:protein myomaker isoform X2 [Polypterus senegalus]|uniref:protein myomaker isoform X2 n=1 Tax=Polypterus senegalus TaxID=55291 RepID=UPI001964D6B9|nr:protein myomaker isoform X2 [Polypterus senegalus]
MGSVIAKMLLPTVSSLAFLPVVSVAAKRGFHMEAMVYFFTMFFMALYHACDGPGFTVLCFMRYEILEYFSVYGTAISMWVTLIGSIWVRHLFWPNWDGSTDHHCYMAEKDEGEEELVSRKICLHTAGGTRILLWSSCSHAEILLRGMGLHVCSQLLPCITGNIMYPDSTQEEQIWRQRREPCKVGLLHSLLLCMTSFLSDFLQSCREHQTSYKGQTSIVLEFINSVAKDSHQTFIFDASS